MEYIEGTDVAHMIGEHGAFEPVAAIGVLEKVAAGLAAIHQEGMVHFDVKPSNVLIGPRYRVCVSDFGLASAAKRGVAGTPAYMAPEVILEKELERPRAHLSDEYSLAVTSYEMLTADLPFEADDLKTLLAAHVNAAPVPMHTRRPSLPAALDEVIARGLAKAPQDRFSDCVTFVSALRRAWADSQSMTLGRRILVVDDDRDVCDFYRAVIEDQFPGVLVTTADDGLQALEIANAEVPDLVLLDLEMPHLEGVGFAQAFRSSPLLTEVPVVVRCPTSRASASPRRFAARRS
jgi:serine/threonine-protein kinase